MRVSACMWATAIVLAAVATIAGCSGREQKSTPAGKTGAREEGIPVDIQLISTAFEDGKTIPIKYTCDADNISPPLVWSNLPDGTQSLTLICDDPDAPMGTFVHWVLYDMPATVTELPEALPRGETLENGAKQGRNSAKRTGYTGPCPPPGRPHRYFFKLYAVDKMLGLSPGADKGEVLSAMEGHVLGESQFMGTYKR